MDPLVFPRPPEVPVPQFENLRPCRRLLSPDRPKLYQLLLPGKRPSDCITHSRHNASIRYNHLVIPEQQLVSWQRRTRIQREETGEELVGVSPPGTNPHSVKVSAGGDGDAQCGGSERFLTTGEKKKHGLRLFSQRDLSSLSLSEACLFFLTYNASINRLPSTAHNAPLSGISPWRERREEKREVKTKSLLWRKKGGTII